MAIEIEDKFLVWGNDWRALVERSTHIKQTYLFSSRWLTVRTRLESGRPAILCVKLKGTKKGTPEYEWRIPTAWAKLCAHVRSRTMKKFRHRVPWGPLTIEVDEFQKPLAPLVVAEVEKPSVDFPYEKPKWFGKEVTNDHRYKNAVLVRNGLPR